MEWNKHHKFRSLYSIYLRALHKFKSSIRWGSAEKHSHIRYCYTSILYTQLLNGARVSEAAEAIYRFYNTGERNQAVVVRKTRKRIIYRLVRVPEPIEAKYLGHILQCFKNIENLKTVKTSNISSWAIKYFRREEGIELNTHTNRYAFITYCIGELNINPIKVQKITKHANLNQITKYTDDEVAQRLVIQIQDDVFDLRGGEKNVQENTE